jgi:hypothetical protein
MPSSISGTYSGPAFGTDWSSAGGTNKTGTFSMDVSFAGGAGSISNFNVSVGGANYTGMSSGTGVIVGSNFTVGSGTACVNNNCSSGVGVATGAFYGPNAQHAGGVWKVSNGTPEYANGVFQGSK